jgi:RecB family endonuclease NucS
MQEYISQISSALERSETIVLGADCTVDYSGRAESHLPQGERIIIIKSDKTLLIHQPHGSNPINYMKENSSYSLGMEDNVLCLKSQNLALKEYINIFINKVHFVQTAPLNDGKKLQIKGTEKDMSDMIYNNPKLVEAGLKPVNQEEQTKYGFIDVLCHDKKGNLVIIECKRYIGDLKAVDQLRRYVEKVKKSKGIEKVRGILACPRMSPNALQMLKDFGFEFAAVKPPNYREKFDKKQKSLGEF